MDHQNSDTPIAPSDGNRWYECTVSKCIIGRLLLVDVRTGGRVIDKTTVRCK